MICSHISIDTTEANIPLRLRKEMHLLEIRVEFDVPSNQLHNPTVWCDDIELFIDYGTEFESQQGMSVFVYSPAGTSDYTEASFQLSAIYLEELVHEREFSAKTVLGLSV